MSDYTQKTKFNLTYLAQEEIHTIYFTRFYFIIYYGYNERLQF